MSWFAIIRLGGVQAAIGAMVMLCTSLLNRVMVVEYAMAAAVPAGLVAWHYAVQLSRPVWGHGSDKGRRRTPWIIGGMVVLASGALLAVYATVSQSMLLAVLAFTMIGAGVGAAGTSLLALLATQTRPDQRAAAAAITWIMMIVGIIVTAGLAGQMLKPFSAERLVLVVCGVAAVAFVLAVVSVWGVETKTVRPECVERLSSSSSSRAKEGRSIDKRSPNGFQAAVTEMLADREARVFTIFVFVSMLAYSMQDMILEPFAGLMFALTPGESTTLSSVQHGGVLAGMLLVGVVGRAFAKDAGSLRSWTVSGCIGSAVALAGLATAARVAPDWPLAANVAVLGFCNGVFAVSAIGAMMALAGAGGEAREGIRMGVWGASQAVAFGLGGLIGAVGVDLGRAAMGADGPAFALVFGVEAGLFLLAALVALRAVAGRYGVPTQAMAGAV
jgi:MFS transporter, BCD family, chlorophyll transporter